MALNARCGKRTGSGQAGPSTKTNSKTTIKNSGYTLKQEHGNLSLRAHLPVSPGKILLDLLTDRTQDVPIQGCIPRDPGGSLGVSTGVAPAPVPHARHPTHQRCCKACWQVNLFWGSRSRRCRMKSLAEAGGKVSLPCPWSPLSVPRTGPALHSPDSEMSSQKGESNS